MLMHSLSRKWFLHHNERATPVHVTHSYKDEGNKIMSVVEELLPLCKRLWKAQEEIALEDCFYLHLFLHKIAEEIYFLNVSSCILILPWNRGTDMWPYSLDFLHKHSRKNMGLPKIWRTQLDQRWTKRGSSPRFCILFMEMINVVRKCQ